MIFQLLPHWLSKVLAQSDPWTIGFIGCGPINAAVAQFLAVVWPKVKRFIAFDLDPARAEVFGDALLVQRPDADFKVAASLEETLSESPMVSFGTTAIKPYVKDLDACFGLGVLDLAVANLVQKTLAENGGGTLVSSFLP